MIKSNKKWLFAAITIFTLSINQYGFANTTEEISSPQNAKTPFFYVTDSNFLLSDSGKNYIKKIDINGKLVKQWEYSDRLDQIAKDPNNNLYVTKHGMQGGDEGILKISNNGSILKKWLPKDGTFLFGIATDSHANVYVTNSLSSRIQECTTDGVYLKAIETAKGPWSIAINAKNEIYVADSFARIVEKFDSNGKLITQWGDHQFFDPWSIALDSNSNAYVLDLNEHCIQKFTSTGVFLKKWDVQLTSGQQGSQSVAPTGFMAIDNNNNVYVADTFGGRIIKFDSNGTQLAIWNFGNTSVFNGIVFTLE